MRNGKRWGRLAVAVCAIAACWAGRADGQAVWEVDGAPLMAIGDIDGPVATRFDRVRSVGFLSGGSIVVADRGSNELRVFHSGGRHEFSAGREGEGPGEFLALAYAVAYRGDSIAAYDFRLRRLTIFDRTGAFGRSLPVAAPPGVEGRPDPWGPTEEGRWTVAWSVPASAPGSVSRSSIVTWSHDESGVPESFSGTYPGRESARSADGDMALDLILPWGLQTLGARRGRILAFGDNGTGTLTVSVDGRERSLSIPWPAEEFAPAILDAYIEEQASFAPPAMSARIEEVFRGVTVPDLLPRFDKVFVSVDGSVWVRKSLPPGRASEAWAIYDSRGTRLAELSAPPGLRIMDASGDLVTGVSIGAFDVESVQIRGLRKR